MRTLDCVGGRTRETGNERTWRTRAAEKHPSEIAERFTVPIVQVPMLDHEVKGLEVLRSLGERMYGMIDDERKASEA